MGLAHKPTASEGSPLTFIQAAQGGDEESRWAVPSDPHTVAQALLPMRKTSGETAKAQAGVPAPLGKGLNGKPGVECKTGPRCSLA